MLLFNLLLSACGEGEREHPLQGCLADRNVVVIVADALPAKRMSCQGNPRPTTPFIDAAAGQGIRFTQAYSQTSWTLSSVASLFTALEQERHGLFLVEERLKPDFTTLAERFKAAGYRTVALMQNYVLNDETGLDRGFDVYENYHWNPLAMMSIMLQARRTLLEEAEAPVFLYLHLLPPHEPYEPPERFRNQYDPGYSGEVDGSIEQAAQLQRAGKGPKDPDVVHLASLADEHLNWVDWEIGNLLMSVRDHGPAEEFLFIITSDHGQAFMEHGKLGHSAHVYEEMVNIPMIFCAPGGPFEPGTVIDEPVSLLDLFPTLADLCDLKAPVQKVNGVSLLPLLDQGDVSLDRPLFYTSRYRKDDGNLQLGMRAGSCKLVLSQRTGKAALYDLAADPAEIRDLSEDRPDVAGEMAEILQRWFEEATRDGERLGPSPRASLSEETAGRLEALGY